MTGWPSFGYFRAHHSCKPKCLFICFLHGISGYFIFLLHHKGNGGNIHFVVYSNLRKRPNHCAVASSHSIVVTFTFQPQLSATPNCARHLGIGRSKFCLKITATNIWPRSPVDLGLLHLPIFGNIAAKAMGRKQHKYIKPPRAPPAHSLSSGSIFQKLIGRDSHEFSES